MIFNLFELGILDWIQENLRCAVLDQIMPVITKLGDGGLFWIALAVVLLIFKKTRKAGISMGVALIIGYVVCNLILKNVTARIRPYDLNPEVSLLIEKLHSFSFPSGHTISSIEASVALLIRNKKLGIPAVILAVIIAFSRLYLYVHYPTDVLVSVLLGIGIAFLASFIVDKLTPTLEKHKIF